MENLKVFNGYLKYWYLSDSVAYGVIYGSTRFEDGTRIHTSNIEDMCMAGESELELCTRNSIYRADFHTAWFAHFEEPRLFDLEKLREKYEKTYIEKVPKEDCAIAFIQPEMRGFVWSSYIRYNGSLINVGTANEYLMYSGLGNNLHAEYANGKVFSIQYEMNMYDKKKMMITKAVCKLPCYLYNVGDIEFEFTQKKKLYKVQPGELFILHTQTR